VTMNVNVVRRDGDDHGPLEVQFEQNYQFRYTVEIDRVAITVDSVQVTIRKGTTIYVDDQAATVDGANGFSYKFLVADHPPDPEEALISEWTITFGADEFIFQAILDVVRTPLTVPIVEDDLFLRFPMLRDSRRLGLEEGLADAASTVSTLVAVELQAYEDGFYLGGEVEIIEGTNISEWRDVTAFVGSTGTATVSPDFPAPIDATSRFRIRRSWQPVIAEAWSDIRQRIKDRGNRAALIMNGQAFRRCLIYIAASMCFESLSQGDLDDPMTALAREYEKRGWELFDATRFLYDDSDRGDPSGDIKQQVTHMTRR